MPRAFSPRPYSTKSIISTASSTSTISRRSSATATRKSATRRASTPPSEISVERTRLKIVFAGTPAFSVAALDALHGAGHQIVGAFTQPDRPAGRGQKLTASPVAQRAAELGLATYKPVSFSKEPEAIAAL